MKVNLIGIFLFFLTLSNASFGSPFDTIDDNASNDGNEEEIIPDEMSEEHENSEAIMHKKDEQNSHKNDTEQEIQEEYKKAVKSFDECSGINLKILDIKTGTKSEMKLKVGESKNFKEVDLKLHKCFRSIDGTKLSFGYISVSGKDFKTQTIIVSSEVALSKTITSKYLVRADCF